MSENRTPKVSVLVPIYNVEKFLRQCLESIVNQTLQDIEIICLNDGSTDSSLDIIKEFAEQDSRIVIIDKPNSGYGDSMNQGLKKARGEYIGIVESDDWIDTNAFAEMYRLAKLDGNADIVRANYYHNKKGIDKKCYFIDPITTGKVVNPKRQTWIFMQAPAIWSAIYRREFLKENHIQFLPTPGASYQDTGFNFKALASAKKIVFTTQAFLHYRTDNEASSVKSDGKIMNVQMEYADIERFLKETDSFDSLGAIMQTAKFGAYYWNILRVSPRHLKDFLKVAKQEYTEAKEQDLLYKEYFDKQKWGLVNSIIDKPVLHIQMKLYWLKFKTKARKAGKKIFFTLRPSYVKQREISNLITEAFTQCDLLEQQIKLLKQASKSTEEVDHE